MKMYRCFDVDEKTPVQFVGVYTTRWRPEWGEPTVMFREATNGELAECEAVEALVNDLQSISIMQTPDIMREVARQALAPFKAAE